MNNVGTNIRKPTAEFSDSEIEHIINTNLVASMKLTFGGRNVDQPLVEEK